MRIDGRVLHITLNRPQVLNALHPPAHFELAEVFDAFAGDSDLWIAVVRGAGNRSFCTGTDLKVRAEQGRDEYPPSGFAGLTRRFDLDKPVVAAVNGLALGGGLEIALACDLIVTAEHAKFGFPEPRVGLAAMGGGVHRLVRQLPDKVAMGLLLTGRQLSAQEALAYGLVNEVVPGERLDDAVQVWVEDMLACAPLALRATKQVARRNLDFPTLAAAIRGDYPAAERMLESEDAVEGPRAFAEKRAPVWRGR
ncbi:MAG: enoyl-CoA hydratase [Caldilineaceae bacterium SB0661_bin_32]|uniref:Enoyl-CoA hydratase n=1 Tax=Caldilineaceae bacterium SB0661_bin_32 TaxID=2605255 RepID=A0A6B1DAI5_9CHLR|nr:enoyl-CoA hydratase [Caldilineaceae bacterium SB0661_bin_32]